MSGLGGIERQAKREFERELLGHVVALAPEGGSVPAERVEQALGYYRHCETGNPVQQLLGRRLRAAVTSLRSRQVLASDAPPDHLAMTPAGRAWYALKRKPWWRRALAGSVE
jgi:hypothetical protein